MVMDISEFIKETIRQVCDGIAQASRECSLCNVIVNPTISVGEYGNHYIPRKPSSVAMQRRVQKIDFDIAVEVTESEELESNGGISLHVITAKGDFQREQPTPRLIESVFPCLYAYRHRIVMMNEFDTSYHKL